MIFKRKLSINDIKTNLQSNLEKGNPALEKRLFVPIIYIMLTKEKLLLYAYFIYNCGNCGNLLLN